MQPYIEKLHENMRWCHEADHIELEDLEEDLEYAHCAQEISESCYKKYKRTLERWIPAKM